VETLDLPWSSELHFPHEGLVRGFALLPSQNGGEVRVGIDRDQYGVFLELRPLMEKAVIFPQIQPLRFRYLEPGSFLQGSPEGTGHSGEHPQHPVTLTRGLWLAETPCTQALWQAVMGKNPSYFTQGEDAPRRPVENVSWDAVDAFLKALQRWLPGGCEAVLPTESQWEYACRAGTQAAYWWGDAPDDTRANWHQQHGGTTPVDRYPPNPWGFYDMHGNVWEWCADGRRDYAAEPARDPEGPGAGDFRVVRGGSWITLPGYARAAFRIRWHRGNAYQAQGFRFALRSPVGPEARPGGPGARWGGAAGGRTEGGEAPAAEPPRRARGERPFFHGRDQDKDDAG
jgi:formylglycine-generating enzyme